MVGLRRSHRLAPGLERRSRRYPCPVVIVLDLHDLVAWAESPAEAFDADLSGRIQSLLQLDIE